MMMSEIMVQLPDTLYHELDFCARQEGVSLNQYILYTLTHQMASGYVMKRVPLEEVQKQEEELIALRTRWRTLASDKKVDQILAEREIAEPDPELTPELVAKVQARIAAAREQKAMRVKESV